MEQLQALLILLTIAAVIVGATLWFLRSVYDSIENREPPPFQPAKPATPDNFKP